MKIKNRIAAIWRAIVSGRKINDDISCVGEIPRVERLVQPEIACQSDTRMIPKLFIFLTLCLTPCAAWQPDAAAIVRRAVDQYAKNDETLRNYTYKAFHIERELDGKGAVKTTHTTLDEIMYIGGRRFTNPLEKDGKPLPEAERKRNAEKLDRAVQEAAKLTPEERKAREAETRRRSTRETMGHVPEAYTLTIVAEPQLNGRPTWQVRAVPRRDYKGPYAAVFRNLEGTLWIDKEDSAWVRFEADTTDTISFGFFLAQIGRGTRISVERSRVNQEVWAPKTLSLKASARLALVKSVHAEAEINYSDYRRFKTDSRLLDPE